MDSAEVAAYVEIRELMALYCRGVDRGDKALIASVYHPDAIDERGPNAVPAGQFADQLVDRMDQLHSVSQHHVTNIYVKYDGDKARCESYVIALQPDAERPGRTLLIGARYFDRLEQRLGAWKIAHRRVVIDYAEPDPDGKPWSRLGFFTLGGRRQHDPGFGFFD